MVELLDQQIEQKFQEFDLLAAAGKKLLSEDHHLAKMVSCTSQTHGLSPSSGSIAIQRATHTVRVIIGS